MSDVRESQFITEGAGGTFSIAGFARRKDLAGTGPVQAVLQAGVTRAFLFPGRWEFLACDPPAIMCLVSRAHAAPQTGPRLE